MSYIVALTGGIASGKTTISKIFCNFGVNIIDTDIIARELVEPGTLALSRIIRRYGNKILNNNGLLRRSHLKKIIFNNANEKKWLNQLMHPLIQKRVEFLKQQTTSPWVLWVVPLLVENNLQNQADRILLVDVSKQIQLNRLLKRDGMTKKQATNIIAQQASRQQRLKIADDIICNDNTKKDLLPIITKLNEKYLSLANIKK
ncbi:dephospho-CoA kinase [Candidatus Ishikawella capsulata]|nr:dephospho-CoA kinase [Candidatus Ishikawaella capsulata]